ncbi:MAG: winged helix-turn-helix domain-containing protein [Terriglobales bacterium]
MTQAGLVPAPAEAIKYRFGEFYLNPQQRRLWRNDRPVSLTPRALDLLSVLVGASGRVLERVELLRAVWGAVNVGDSNLTVNLCAVRRALGDCEHFIATVPGRGYQFTTPVTVELPAVEAAPARWLVLMPLRCLGQAQRHPNLVSALAPALVVALSPLPQINLRPAGAAPRLGVDWRLEGCYQELDGEVRLTAELIRPDDSVAWAGFREFPATGNFRLHDRAAAWLKSELAAPWR